MRRASFPFCGHYVFHKREICGFFRFFLLLLYQMTDFRAIPRESIAMSTSVPLPTKLKFILGPKRYAIKYLGNSRILTLSKMWR
jgi:hypothetical protein